MSDELSAINDAAAAVGRVSMLLLDRSDDLAFSCSAPASMRGNGKDGEEAGTKADLTDL